MGRVGRSSVGFRDDGASDNLYQRGRRRRKRRRRRRKRRRNRCKVEKKKQEEKEEMMSYDYIIAKEHDKNHHIFPN